jgi:hypothetical protein
VLPAVSDRADRAWRWACTAAGDGGPAAGRDGARGLRAAGRPRSHVGTHCSRSFVMPNRATHSVHRPGAKEAISNEQLVTRVVIFIMGNPGVMRPPRRTAEELSAWIMCRIRVHQLSIGDPREMWSPGGPRRRRRLLPRTDQQDEAGVDAKRHGGGSPGRRTRPDPGPRPVRTSRSTRTTRTTRTTRLRTATTMRPSRTRSKVRTRSSRAAAPRTARTSSKSRSTDSGPTAGADGSRSAPDEAADPWLWRNGALVPPAAPAQ